MSLYRIIPGENYLAHHGRTGQKWGVRNGPPYPLGSQTLANNIFNDAKSKEPKITKDVTNSALASGSKMYGLDHRLKTKPSIQRKIEDDSKEKGISVNKAAEKLTDAIRYTTITDDDSFVSSYSSFKNSLGKKGYKEIRCRNYFDMYNKGEAKHKSVQSVFEDPSGYRFEVQFQTPSSQVAKNKKIPIYEERRRPGLSVERQQELERQMDQLAKKVKDPKDIAKIRTYGG